MPTPEVLDPPTRAERADAATDDVVDTDAARDLLASVAPPLCTFAVHDGGALYSPDSKDDAPKCGIPATWALVLSCSHLGYLCDEHHAAVHRAIGRNYRVVCTYADGLHSRGLPVTWHWTRL